jgi:ribosomal protein S3AE
MHRDVEASMFIVSRDVELRKRVVADLEAMKGRVENVTLAELKGSERRASWGLKIMTRIVRSML